MSALKPYTSYICPNDTGGLGHKSSWTGAYLSPRPGDHLCMCGAELVEEDDERWELSWEMDTGTGWRTVTAERTRHAMESQKAGLLELIGQGEPIRNVRARRLTVVAGEWS